MGVFPYRRECACTPPGLPHARGGVSSVGWAEAILTKSSPRPWGCFSGQEKRRPCSCVFPTPVGVFPTWQACTRHMPCLPHARGGVSYQGHEYPFVGLSSPRPWGCFTSWRTGGSVCGVFPTPVGGVSLEATELIRKARSSPRPWGCFLVCINFLLVEGVFPTPVGVFLQ